MNYARARGIIRKYQVEGTVQKEMEEEVRPGAHCPERTVQSALSRAHCPERTVQSALSRAHCPERTVQSDRRTARSANKPEAKSTLLSPP